MSLTKRNRRSFRTTHSRQLRLEPLEDRRLLAVITVDSFLDNFDPGAPTTDGLITLREAILAANTDAVVGDAPAGSGTDTIEFDNALSGQTIILDGMDLEITEAVTIDATPLAANVTIDAGSLSRIFNITATTGDFTLAGLTLTGGMTTGNNVNSSDTTFSGGAVRSLTTGSLTIDQSTVSYNSTTGNYASGSGIRSRGAITITSSTVSGNSTAGDIAKGGGIFSSGPVTLTNSTVSGNSTAGFIATGGGIYSFGALTLTNSTVSGNSTTGSYGYGAGAITFGDVTIVSSTVSDNHANDSNATGGIWNNNDVINITNSIVAGNTDGGGSVNDIRPGTGPLASFSVNYSLIGTGVVPDAGTSGNNVVTNNPLIGPLADNGGPTETHALLVGSPAIDAGNPGFTSPPDFDQRGTGFPRVSLGRIDMGAYEFQVTFPAQGLVVDTTTDVVDGDFTIGNLALREAILFANLDPLANTITFDASLSGQTITLGGSELLINDELTIDATALDANVTIDANMQSRVIKFTAFPGDLTLSGLNITGGRTLGEFDDGGGIRFGSNSTLTLNSSNVSGNSTAGDFAYGGGIWSFSGAVTLNDSTVSDNSTSGLNANGGGIRTHSGAVTLTDSTVSGNSTTGFNAPGGGIRTYSGAVMLSNSTVSGNSTTGSNAPGGGIRTSFGDVMLTDSTVSGNSTLGSDAPGGGIRTFYGDVMLTDSTVSGNSTAGFEAYGGGIYTSSGAVTLTGSTISGNSTAGNEAYGGGIFTISGAVTLTGSTVSGNSTAGFIASGGGIRTNFGAMTLTDSTVSGNSTTGTFAGGGGIRTTSGPVTLTGSTVSGNSSTGSNARGGGILTTLGAVTLTSSTVTGNSAKGAGVGVYVFDTNTNPTLTITNSIVAGNTDNGIAADLRPDPESTLNVDFSLIGDTTDSGITVGTGTGNILNQSAQLGLLTNNGGPTLTHALRVGSPAIDAGNPGFTSPPNFDQRGAPFVREAGLRIDIGAYERQTVAGLNLTVDTNVDENDGNYSAGDLSLREAVGLANGSIGANTILFAAALSGQAITLGGTELEISEELTIDATALAANVTIDANMQSRVLRFSTNPGDLTLSGLTITGGRTLGEFDDGGGIRFGSNGTLTLNSSTVSDNSTSGDLAYGGGIWTFGGAVTLTGSTVSDNSTSGLNANGGGIRTYSGAVTLTDSTVSGNSTTGDLAPGGGIFTASGAVTLTDSTVSGNSTSGDLAYGGGIFTASGAVTLTGSTVSGNSTTGSAAAGGGIRTYFGAVTLTDSTVSGNSTTGTNAYGGGIRTSSVSGTVTLTGSTVSGNSSTGTFASGGGIRTFEGAVTLTGSTVSGNFSGNRGGGIFTSFGDVMLTDSTVSGNTSVGDGGGIRTYSSVVTLHSSTVTGNLAYGAGGGVHVYDSTTNPTLTIANSIVAGNTAVGAGPDLRPDPDSTLVVDFSLIGDTTGTGITAGTGSGNILNQPALLGPLADNSGPTLTHALLVGSLAIDAGNPGFIPPPDFDQRGAPFAREAGLRIDIGAYERQTLDPSFFIVTTTTDELDYSNADVSLREAIYSANGSIDADTILFAAALSGQTITLGGTELEITEALTIDATALATNVTIDANMQSRVLRFTALAGDLTLSGLTITGGQTTGLMENGGGIRFDSAGTLTLNSSTLSGNKTTGSGLRGGGIFTYSGAVTLTSSTVSGNSTSGPNANGGGIRTYSGAVTLSNSTVSGNSTAGTFADGGGISTYSGVVTLTNSTVSGNVSAGAGGGIYTDSAVTLMGSTVTGNTAAGAGGGVYVTDTDFNPTLTIANSIVAGNTAGGGMDDIDPGTGTLNIDFSLIEQVGLPLGGSGNIIGMPANLGPLADNGGPTLTHSLLQASPALDAGDPTAMAGVGGVPMFDQRGMPFGRVEDGDGNMVARIDMGAYEVQPPTPTCDFDGMNGCSIDDIDAMVMEIVAGTNSPLYDLTDDGLVNLADRDQWLADAGALNLTSGNPYLLGDSNLDGVVDGQDFIDWNANKFMSTGKWSQADWNADGVTDGQDFIIWNGNKFQSSDGLLRSVLPSASHPSYEIAPTVDLQTREQSTTRLLGISQIIPSTNTKRIDAVFAGFHQREERVDEQRQADIFDALIEDFPMKSYLL